MTTDPTYSVHARTGERGDVTMRMSHPQGHHGHRVHLEVIDRLSGTPILDVDLSPEQFTLLMGGASLGSVRAKLPLRPDLIGKRAETISGTVGLGVDGDSDKRASELAEHFRSIGYTHTEIRRTNTGRQVVGTRWIDEQEGTDPR